MLNQRVGTVEAATPESAIVITHRDTEADGESWLSLSGSVADAD